MMWKSRRRFLYRGIEKQWIVDSGQWTVVGGRLLFTDYRLPITDYRFRELL